MDGFVSDFDQSHLVLDRLDDNDMISMLCPTKYEPKTQKLSLVVSLLKSSDLRHRNRFKK